MHCTEPSATSKVLIAFYSAKFVAEISDDECIANCSTEITSAKSDVDSFNIRKVTAEHLPSCWTVRSVSVLSRALWLNG